MFFSLLTPYYIHYSRAEILLPVFSPSFSSVYKRDLEHQRTVAVNTATGKINQSLIIETVTRLYSGFHFQAHCYTEIF